MENLLVREANMDDLPTLKAFEQQIIIAERPFDPTIRPDPVSYYSLERLIKASDSQIIVATIGTEVVASGSVRIKTARHYLDHENYAYLGFMYTKPAYRGKGINKLVMDKLLGWAREHDLYEVRLTVYQDNFPAIRAYEKTGFASHLNEMRLRLKSDL